MAKYRVKWEIDVESETAEEAAKEVWDHYLGPDGELGTATIVDVYCPHRYSDWHYGEFDMVTEEGS